MNSDEVLTKCFRDAGARYGYDKVTAEFVPFKDLKARWQRSYRWAAFKISDYLSDAPPEVVKALAESMFGKIAGRNESYPQSVKEWVARDEFCRSKQPVFLSRLSPTSYYDQGVSKDLRASLERLEEQGFMEHIPGLVVNWTREYTLRRPGHTSVLMKVVSITDDLDKEDVPDEVLDWIVYCELCHLKIGFDPDGDVHESVYRSLLEAYPGRDAAEEWIERKISEDDGRLRRKDGGEEQITWRDD